MQILERTQTWINEVVIGCNFCPFASKAMLQKSVHYHVMETELLQTCLEQLVLEMQRLDQNKEIETTLIILPIGFADFEDYLDLLEIGNQLLADMHYEGIYQLASFHPDFLFDGTPENDAANYTNRSPYPMLHLLREESISRAVDFYPDIDGIPDRNIEVARTKGVAFFQQLLKA